MRGQARLVYTCPDQSVVSWDGASEVRRWLVFESDGTCNYMKFGRDTLLKDTNTSLDKYRILMNDLSTTILGGGDSIVFNVAGIRALIRKNEVYVLQSKVDMIDFVKKMGDRLSNRILETANEEWSHEQLLDFIKDKERRFEFVALDVLLHEAWCCLEMVASRLELETVDTDPGTPKSIDSFQNTKEDVIDATHLVQNVKDVLKELQDNDLKRTRIHLVPEVDETKKQLECIIDDSFDLVNFTSKKLKTMKENVNSTERHVSFRKEKQTLSFAQITLIVTLLTFSVGVVAMVGGVFGMNFQTGWFTEQKYGSYFIWAVVVSFLLGGIGFLVALYWSKRRRLLES